MSKINFAIENIISDGKKNEFTPEREQKVEGKVFVSHYISGSRESNCNVNLKSDNVLSVNDEDLVNIPVNLGETEINISHNNENRSDKNNTELGGSITTDEPSIDRTILTDEGQINGLFFKSVHHKILTEIEMKVLKKGLEGSKNSQ